jgi:chemotaxis protein histidine kinase CheA
VVAEYSRSVETLFALHDLQGKRLPVLLAEVLGEDKAALARDYLKTLFNPNVIERLVKGINPLRQVRAEIPGRGTRHLAFSFRRSVDGGVIGRVLVRVEDVTRQVELAREVEAQETKARQKVDLAFDIVRADPALLAAFLDKLERGLESCRELLRGSTDAATRLAAIYRHLHAVKGEASMLGLELVPARIHQAEDRVAELREKGTEAVNLAVLVPALDDLALLARETRELVEQFGRLGGAAAPSPGLFDGVSRLVEDLAERHGKSACFVAHNDASEIPGGYLELVRETLVQLARNAVVHGLETPEERRRRGKPEAGTLQFAVRRHPEQGRVEFVFQDDGAGLDLERIRRRAAELGRPINGGGDAEVARLVFESGFSTARDASIDAGRGVGLDVVKARVEALGGTITAHSRPGELCAFQILLPAEVGR